MQIARSPFSVAATRGKRKNGKLLLLQRQFRSNICVLKALVKRINLLLVLLVLSLFAVGIFGGIGDSLYNFPSCTSTDEYDPCTGTPPDDGGFEG